MAQKDAWRAYYELALGLTETSRKKAMKIVKNVAGKGGGTADQLQELVNTAVANREAVARMVKVEIDRALGRVGLATMEEVDELTRRVRDLERELSETRAVLAESPAPDARITQALAAEEPGTAETAPRGAATAPAAKKVGKKAVAKKAVAKKTVAKKTIAKKAEPAVAAPVKATTAGRAPAKQAVKKAAPGKTATKKATPTKSMKPAKASVTRQTIAEQAQ
jgi:polyhydroxyalkanoate synthesis regulator phasin